MTEWEISEIEEPVIVVSAKWLMNLKKLILEGRFIEALNEIERFDKCKIQ